jgi:hypothetical protein
MKTLMAILICFLVMVGILAIICCMASSMVSQREEKRRKTDG